MAKTEKELLELKKKVEEVNRELNALSEEELTGIAGGTSVSFCPLCNGAKSAGGRKCPRCAGMGVIFIR